MGLLSVVVLLVGGCGQGNESKEVVHQQLINIT